MLNAEEISAVLEQVLSIAINCVSNTASTGIDPDGGNAVIRIKVSDWLHIFLLSEEFLADLSFAGYYLIETGCVSDHPVKKQPIVRVLRRPCEAGTVYVKGNSLPLYIASWSKQILFYRDWNDCGKSGVDINF